MYDDFMMYIKNKFVLSLKRVTCSWTSLAHLIALLKSALCNYVKFIVLPKGTFLIIVLIIFCYALKYTDYIL